MIDNPIDKLISNIVYIWSQIAYIFYSFHLAFYGSIYINEIKSYYF
jgi:hypothetical protein